MKLTHCKTNSIRLIVDAFPIRHFVHTSDGTGKCNSTGGKNVAIKPFCEVPLSSVLSISSTESYSLVSTTEDVTSPSLSLTSVPSPLTEVASGDVALLVAALKAEIGEARLTAPKLSGGGAGNNAGKADLTDMGRPE